MALPATQVSDPLAQLNFEVLGRMLRGPFVLSMGAITPGNEAVAAFTHNQNADPAKTIVVAHLEDGVYAGRCSWRVAPALNSTSFIVYNRDPTNTATVLVHFGLLVFR